jgi:hypothetical protein
MSPRLADVRFIDALKRVWSPAAQTLPTDVDRAAIAAMDGRRFEYSVLTSSGVN